MRIKYFCIADLPKLAWLSRTEPNSQVIEVIHGSAVECHDNWAVEGVWDGPFEKGDFHRTENFFGSGIRIEGNSIHFVPSCALVDRLFYCFHDRNLLVSNSVIFLLAFTGSSLLEKHDYGVETRSILKGIKNYKKEFAIDHHNIESFYQVYYENFVLKHGKIFFETRGKVQQINSFDEYYQLLTESLRQIQLNYQSRYRKVPLSAFTTVSSGYDSTAVSCLVKNIGVSTCFTGQRSSSSIPRWVSKSIAIDDGKPIADALGLRTRYLDISKHTITEDELYFYSGSCARPEINFSPMTNHIEKTCSAAVVFTGYHGDKVWDASPKGKYISPNVIRGDVSGLNLSEVRLKSGFINIAVPFILARNIESIVKISNSLDMRPWSVNRSYNRPIARRIAESAGVPGELFGIQKKAFIKSRNYPLHPGLRRQFFEFLKKSYGIRGSFVYLDEITNRVIGLFVKAFFYIKFRERSKALSIISKRKYFFRDVQYNKLLFVWSAHVLREKTAEILRKSKVIPTEQL